MHIMRKLSKLHDKAADIKKQQDKDKAAKKIIQLMPKIIKAAESGKEEFTYTNSLFDSASYDVYYAMVPLLQEQGFKARIQHGHETSNLYLKVGGWTDSQWSKDDDENA